MPLLTDLGVAGAGFVVGIVNTIAGAGSLLSFPVLLAAGLSPLAANVTNTLGVTSAAVTGSIAQRSQLEGRRPLLLALTLPTAAGAVFGTVLLLTLPSGVFDKVIPVLVAIACLLVLCQPLIARRARRSTGDGVMPPGELPHDRTRAAQLVMLALGTYGGYFGAALGIMLIGVLGVLLPLPLRQINALKTVLAGIANGVAAIVFAIVAPVHWVYALILAVSAGLGGPVGGRLSVRLRPGPLRAAIGVIGLGVSAYLAVKTY